MTIVLVAGDFEFCVAMGAGVCRLIGSLTLGDELVLGGLLCLTSTIFCAVYLLGDYYGVVFCLKISDNFLMDCNFLATIDANKDVGAGFAIASIKYTAALVSAS